MDSPAVPAPRGERSRAAERELVRARVCGIRFTPDQETIQNGGGYYEWIRCGFDLYEALAAAPFAWTVIEVYPTAAWTRWCGPRGAQTRERWSSAGLCSLGISGVPSSGLNQDGRDAIAAALTAQLYAAGRVERFGEIVVPETGSGGSGVR